MNPETYEIMSEEAISIVETPMEIQLIGQKYVYFLDKVHGRWTAMRRELYDSQRI